MSNQFIKLNLKSVPQGETDELTAYLFEIGAQGVSEKLDFTQTSRNYEPEILEKDLVDLEVFFNLKEKESLESCIAKPPLKLFHPEIEIELNKDWLEEWKKHYSPFCVVEDLWVFPSWNAKEVKEGQLALLVDPGLAFGTGTHETTELCMKALYGLLKKDHSYSSALDMGAGTGILAVLMKKLGVSSILACEIDEMAREKCRENLELNGVGEIQVVGPEDLNEESYDIVVANIIDGVLLKLKEQLVASTSKTLLLSGILKENEEEVIKAFVDLGLRLESQTEKAEWVCLVMSVK